MNFGGKYLGDKKKRIRNRKKSKQGWPWLRQLFSQHQKRDIFYVQYLQAEAISSNTENNFFFTKKSLSIKTHLPYRISSNNSRPSINRPPFDGNAYNNRSYPAPLAIFSSFYLLPVKVKCNKIQQNWSGTIQALKINQGTKLGILKKPLFSLFDVIIFWFNKKIKQNV